MIGRDAILQKFRAMIAAGEPIIGGGAGTGLSAKCEEAGGIDLIVIYNSGRYRMAGRGSLAGLMPYGDANAIVLEMAGEVLPVVKSTPVLAGVCATDPFRIMDVFLDELKRVGFSGVQNFPTVGLIDGTFRANLEETGMSYGLEVDMIAKARAKNMLTTPYVFCEEDAEAMARAGADVIVCHLGLTTGDQVEVELNDGQGRKVMVPLVGVTNSYVGLNANMSLEALDRLSGQGSRISGARVIVDDNRILDLYDEVKQTPAIASVALQRISLKRFRAVIEENIGISITIYVALAVIITFGVIYNSARIQLSERARELASLRVFGFTNREVSSVLLTELGVMVILAQPLGWLIGRSFSVLVAKGFESDLFRIPLIINPPTYAISSLIVLGGALVSALIVRRRIDRLDLIRVLKTRD